MSTILLRLALRRSALAGLIVGLAALSQAALAQSPAAQPELAQPISAEAFAWQWSLPVAPEQDMVSISLTQVIYAKLLRDDLRDFAAFNADGESLPFGPALPAQSHTLRPATAKSGALPTFRVPRSQLSDPERLSLHVERDGNGRLRQLHAEIVSDSEAASIDDWLLDLSGLQGKVRGLHIGLEDAALGALNARVEIAASRDLNTWQIIAPSQTLLSLRRGEMNLERLSVEFAPDDWPYLRLRRIDEESTLPLTQVVAELALPTTIIDERLALQITGAAVVGQPGIFEYRLDGPYPIERVGVELADRNGLAIVVLESRASSTQNWRERARGTAFRLGGNTDDTSAAPFELPHTRDRQWRVRSEPALPRPPTLRVGYRKELFVLLAQGPQPYRLVAGSAYAVRPEYPLQAVLQTPSSPNSLKVLANPITVGAGRQLSGYDLLNAKNPPLPLRQWLLWSVLIAASALIVILALRLLRQPNASRAPSAESSPRQRK